MWLGPGQAIANNFFENAKQVKYAIQLSIFACVIFALFSYWGIRSPDGEVIFRTTQALATQGEFAVSDDAVLNGFGLSRGKDGKLYSLFGPGEAIAAAPLYRLAEAIERTDWYRNAPSLVGKSFFVHGGISSFLKDRIPQDLAPHALRMVVCSFNILVCSLCVLVFFLTIKALTRSEQSALLTSVLFAFGSLLFPYSGTFFSEPLATFWVMLSFYILVRDGGKQDDALTPLALLAAGAALGLAVATHITAILFAPFFCIYAAFLARQDTGSRSHSRLAGVAIFSAGLGVLLVLLGYYNFARFGDVLETGRTAGTNSYGTFVAPWRGLWGELCSAGKGLVFYCPAFILGLAAWRPFHRKHRILSLVIAAAALFRVIFIASRSDWHGGFCLGPRYMVMLIPFLMLPIGVLVNEFLSARKRKAMLMFSLFTLACIAQQIYFSLGEIFSYLYSVKWSGMNRGVNVLMDDVIYLDWHVSPLLHLLDGQRGPLLSSSTELGNYSLWLLLVAVAAVALVLLYLFTLGAKFWRRV